MADKKGKKGGKKGKKKPCPEKWKDMCAAINDWAEEWQAWGKIVQKEVNLLSGNGGPGKVPDPPDPPFGG